MLANDACPVWICISRMSIPASCESLLRSAVAYQCLAACAWNLETPAFVPIFFTRFLVHPYFRRQILVVKSAKGSVGALYVDMYSLTLSVRICGSRMILGVSFFSLLMCRGFPASKRKFKKTIRRKPVGNALVFSCFQQGNAYLFCSNFFFSSFSNLFAFSPLFILSFQKCFLNHYPKSPVFQWFAKKPTVLTKSADLFTSGCPRSH